MIQPGEEENLWLGLLVPHSACVCPALPFLPLSRIPLELSEFEHVRNAVGEVCCPRMPIFSPHCEPIWYREKKSGGAMPGNSAVVLSC